ncbi:hypothetical protein EJ06DRAFT_188350 [Trichodelitschia bisporula]|uniref:Uncharacterized protein n=1 Tax=Trichodelitschia bisporula TaxID=703511 RepID=A0A6G1I748_9PEZI|nr:hypothetical protein EJ06DRAFT_188350 [Trichodelitschia bisporula]
MHTPANGIVLLRVGLVRTTGLTATSVHYLPPIHPPPTYPSLAVASRSSTTVGGEKKSHRRVGKVKKKKFLPPHTGNSGSLTDVLAILFPASPVCPYVCPPRCPLHSFLSLPLSSPRTFPVKNCRLLVLNLLACLLAATHRHPPYQYVHTVYTILSNLLILPPSLSLQRKNRPLPRIHPSHTLPHPPLHTNALRGI